MKVSIRLQNHGKKNHPLWYIVVAPNRKNIKGRFLQHVGFWSPRQGKYLKRRICLNIPRIKYWLACGAVPTYKVHNFLTFWNIIPAEWRYEKSAQELEKLKPNEQQLTDKQKIKLKRRLKKKQRQQTDPRNYPKQQSRAYFSKKLQRQFAQKIKAESHQNQLLRQILYAKNFNAMKRIDDLSNRQDPNLQKIRNLKQQLQKAKSQLIMIKKQNMNKHPLIKQKLVQKIQKITESLNVMLSQNKQQRFPQKPQSQSQYVTQNYLDKEIQYALLTKKIKKSMQELKQFKTLNQPISIEQLASYFMQKRNYPPQKAYDVANAKFQQAGLLGKTIRKIDIQPGYKSQLSFDKNNVPKFRRPVRPQNAAQDLKKNLKRIALDPRISLPSAKPVHPIPDFKSYIPQQYYEPLEQVSNVKIVELDSLEPYQQLAKYHEKRKKRVDQL